MNDLNNKLIEAIKRRDADEVKALVDQGANPNASTLGGTGPLVIAANCGHVQTIVALMEVGADPNAIGEDGMTALDTAAYNGNTAAVEALLAGGAWPNCVGASGGGWTAIMCAASHVHEHVETTAALLAAGADPAATNDKGHSALDIALMRRHHVIAELLREALAKRATEPVRLVVDWAALAG